MNKKIVVCISILSLYSTATFGMSDQAKLQDILTKFKSPGIAGTKYTNLLTAINAFTGDVNTKFTNGSRLLIELAKDSSPSIIEPIKALLGKGADPALKDGNDWKAIDYASNANKDVFNLLLETQNNLQDFVEAAKKGDMKIVRDFLAKSPEKINNFAPTRIGGQQLNALMAAAANSRLPMINELLSNQYKADVNIQNENGYTALILACITPDNRQVIEALLKAGADATIADKNGQTALMHAILSKNISVVDGLVKKSDINALDKNDKTVLDLANDANMSKIAASLKKLYGAKTYTELQAQPPAPAQITVKEFVQAAHDGDLAKVQQFLANPESVKKINEFADIREEGIQPITSNALFAAVKESKEAIINELVKHRELAINTQDQNKNTALHVAVFKENQNIITTLLNNGANPNIRDSFGMTPLMRAVQMNNTDSVNALLNNQKTDANLKSNKDFPQTWETALWIALNKGNPNKDIIKALVDKGADITIKNRQGKLPLQFARDNNLTEIETILEQKSPSIETKLKALEQAIEKNLPAEVKDLLRDADIKNHINDLTTINNEKRTFLTYAAGQRNIDHTIIQALLGAGANINGTDHMGDTALMQAVLANNQSLVTLLLDNNANVNAQSEAGDKATALMLAAEWAPHLISLLLARGARIDLKNKYEETALDIAKRNNNGDSIKFLEEAAKKQQPSQQVDLGTVYQNLMQLNTALRTLQQTLRPSFR